MSKQQTVNMFDRIISVISYLTAGWGGMIFCALMYFAKKKMSYFVKYNIFQSILLSLLYFCIAMLADIILKILSLIPFLNYLVAQIAFLFNRPILGAYSLLQVIVIGIILYSSLFALLGKLPRIYRISNLIDSQARQ